MSNKSNAINVEIPQKITLDKAETGKHYIIKDISLASDIRTRLAEMGLTRGAEVVVMKKAPFGDPLEISVRGYSLCIRAAEAEKFEVWEAEK